MSDQKLVDSFNLPLPLLAVLGEDNYSKEGADFSVTELSIPVLVRALNTRYGDQVTKEASERIYMLFGKIVHQILENAVKILAEKNVTGRWTAIEEVLYSFASGDVASDSLHEAIALAVLESNKEYVWDHHGLLFEKRFFADIPTKYGTKKVSGQVDLYDRSGLITPDRVLNDYKVCSVFAMKSLKDEWVAQGNRYRYLLHVNGLETDRVIFHPIARDWVKRKAMFERGYPKQQTDQMEIPLWSLDQTLEDMIKRIEAHIEAEEMSDENIPLCTPEERWTKEEHWAVMKKGRATAIIRCDSPGEAHAWINKNQKPKEVLYVEHRPGVNTRCQLYCDVANFCTLGRKEKQ